PLCQASPWTGRESPAKEYGGGGHVRPTRGPAPRTQRVPRVGLWPFSKRGIRRVPGQPLPTRCLRGEERTKRLMTHTVCQPCYDCKYTDCVAVCPVECFYQDDMMLYIDPNDCIDCEACVPECPVEAIFAEANVPSQWTQWTQINADKS